MRRIMLEGTLKSDRTGTGTISLFGQQMRFDLSAGFPLLTTKTVFFKGLAYELLWFLKGSSNVRWLQERAGLPVTGVMDQATWDALARLYELFVVKDLEQLEQKYSGGWG